MPSRHAKKRSLLRRLTPLLVSVLVFVGLAYGIVWAFLPASASPRPKLVEIPQGSTNRQIAQRLKREGIIRSAWAFMAFSRVLGESQNLRAGDYRLSPHLSLAQVIRLLAAGEAVNRWVTIPEGYTVKQISELLGGEGVVEPERLRRIARLGGRSFEMPNFDPPSNLEGYLFPDTYKLPHSANERKVLQLMLRNFDAKVAEPLRGQIPSPATGFDLRKTIILASLVEREAKKPEERARIAGVILNRLRRGMKLQVDATVQFAWGFNRPRLLYKDLEIRSPYNTYLHHGLPPGPICNPGLDAIRAALQPESHDYLFYVARPDGSHLFSRTAEEHQAAVQQARSEARDR